MIRWIFHTICLALLLLVMSSAVFADKGELTGSAELLYAGQTTEIDGTQTLDANHFVQQYSLLYSKKGQLKRGRLGEYDVALGYEWNWVDSEVNGQKVDIDNPLDKILYRGDIKIAPGGLPFSLHAFSYDMHQTDFTKSDLGTLFANDGQTAATGGIVTDINNGTHHTMGLTLMAGVQNGHYQGQYRDMLATVPRLLIDYRQQVVRDVKGPSPRNYEDRDLAFVSLNKKKNWFHYRRFEHIDKLDAGNNSSEDTFLLGTIDHTDRRQWVNLTNWIQISTDISYTDSHANRSQDGVNNGKRYDVNVFAKALRSRWTADNFTSFSRVRTGDRLEHRLEVPILARGELNRDTSWRFQLESLQYQDEVLSSGLDRERDGLFLRGQVEAFRQARYVVRPRIELENKSGTEGEGQSGVLGIELYSNSRYRSNSDLFAGYNILYASGTGTTGNDVSYMEHQLELRMEDRTGDAFRWGAEETLSYGDGQYDFTVADRIRAQLSSVGTFDGGSGYFDDTLFNSKTSVFAETTLFRSVRNRFSVDYELIDSDTVSAHQVGLTHWLGYDSGGLALHWTNNYVMGDGVPGSSVNPAAGGASKIDGSATSQADFDSSFSSALRLFYSKGRSSQFRFAADYENFNYRDGSNAERARAEESYEYTIWHVNGRVRKLLVLGQSAEYDKAMSFTNQPESLQAYSVYTNYYPTYRTLLSARLRYEIDEIEDTETLLSFLSAGVDFAKFQASIDYSYGHRPESATNPEVLEQKWEVKVKKTF